MSELYANDYVTALASPVINGVVTTIDTLTPAPADLQGGEFRIRIEDEIMIVTGGQSGTTWTVTRGAESFGSGGVAHPSAAIVNHVLTRGSLQLLGGGTDMSLLLMGG